MTEEDEPSKEYLKGYNQGYQLAKHEPELLEKILKSQSGDAANDYIKALAKGKAQYDKERMVAEIKQKRDRQEPTNERDR